MNCKLFSLSNKSQNQLIICETKIGDNLAYIRDIGDNVAPNRGLSRLGNLISVIEIYTTLMLVAMA